MAWLDQLQSDHSDANANYYRLDQNRLYLQSTRNANN